MTVLRQLTARHQLGVLIFVTTLLRLLFAQTGFGIDESYAVATSKAFHLSIYDHPPISWWLAGLMQHLFHTTTPWVVRLPFILLSAVATWQVYRLTNLLFSDKAAIFAALIFSAAPVLGVTTATWVLPDGPLLVALLAGAICLAHLSFDKVPDGRWWLAAGLWGGVAMLSKYHGIFFFFGAFVFVVSSKPMWRWLRSPYPYLGALIGIALFSPVVIWNVQHHWASFAFQSGRTGESHFHPFKPLQTLLGQAAFLTPWVWLGLAVAGVQAAKAGVGDPKRWMLLCLAVPMIALFTLVSAVSSGTILYHWAMPGYLFLVPLLGDWLARRPATRTRWVRRWLVTACSITVALVSLVLFLWFAPATVQQWGLPRDPLADVRPFTEVNAYLDTHGFAGRDDIVFAPTKWHFAGRFDIALKGRLSVTCFCRDAREYGILAPLDGMVGKDFIIPVPLKNAAAAEKDFAQHFMHFKRLDDLNIQQGDTVLEGFAMFYGTRLKSALSLD